MNKLENNENKPSIRTLSTSLMILKVTINTITEKRKVQIGSTIPHSGKKYIIRAAVNTPIL